MLIGAINIDPIVLEIATGLTALAMTSVFDTSCSDRRLESALRHRLYAVFYFVNFTKSIAIILWMWYISKLRECGF